MSSRSSRPAALPRDGVRAAVVMLAAGEGRRAGHGTNKVLLPLAGRRVFSWSVRAAAALRSVTRTVLVIREADREQVEAAVLRELADLPITVVVGGETRHESEWRALQALAPSIEAGEVDVVVIHDAARPLATTLLFGAVVDAAARHGGAIPVREQPGLLGLDEATAVPSRVVAVQTPQAFAAGPVLAAYRRAEGEGFRGSDTASCIERYTDLPVTTVAGDAGNIKITFPEDLFLAERLLAKADFDLTGRASS